MTITKRVQLSCMVLLIVLISATQGFAQAISLYGGLSFPPSPLKTSPGQELAAPLIIKIVGTNEKGDLVPAKDSGVPVRENFNARAGKLESELWTHAAGVTWQFTKAGLQFTADDAVYLTEKDGATIAFTKDGLRMEGLTKRQSDTKSAQTDIGKSSSDQSRPIPALFLGKWSAVDDKSHFVVVSTDTISWERGDMEGPEIVPISKCTIAEDKHSVSFPIRSSVGAVVSGKLVRGTTMVQMAVAGDTLTITEGSSTPMKDAASGFGFQQIAGQKHVFKRVPEK